MKQFLFFLISLGPGSLAAEILIEWSSDGGGVDRQSDGVTPLDGQFEFVLGTFEGITPSRENLVEWEEAFRMLGTVDYQASFQRFSGAVLLSSNAAPFTTTARAYVWGRNGSGPGSEWILFGKPEWRWPNTNPFGPPPLVHWRSATVSGDDVIVGSVGSGEVQMQTEKVSFAMTFAAWAASNFEEGEESSPTADFDADGRNNFAEYALGSDPKAVDGPFQVELNGRSEIVVKRAPGREVVWVLRESDDLVTFTDMTDGFEVLVDEPDRLVLGIMAHSPSPRFFQVEARP